MQIFSNYFIEAFGEDYDVWNNIILASKRGVCVCVLFYILISVGSFLPQVMCIRVEQHTG